MGLAERPPWGQFWQQPLPGVPAALVALGWCQQGRQGKSVQFALVWFAPLALPTPPPPYNPAAPHTYEGPVHGSRTPRRLAAVTRTAPPAAANNDAGDPQRPQARLGASGKRWGCCMPWGVQNFRRCVCVYVCLRVVKFSDSSFKTFSLTFLFLIGASKINK